jgi:hypothetical protein
MEKQVRKIVEEFVFANEPTVRMVLEEMFPPSWVQYGMNYFVSLLKEINDA